MNVLEGGSGWSSLLASLNSPGRVRQVVVATDDPVLLDAIETCLFDKQIQALVLPLRDLPPPPDPGEERDEELVELIQDPDARQRLAQRLAISRERGLLLQELRRIVSMQERLLTASAEYVAVAQDNLQDGTDPAESIEWADESLRRAREVHDGLRRLTDRLI
jgi:hypothetical protein